MTVEILKFEPPILDTHRNREEVEFLISTGEAEVTPEGQTTPADCVKIYAEVDGQRRRYQVRRDLLPVVITSRRRARNPAHPKLNVNRVYDYSEEGVCSRCEKPKKIDSGLCKPCRKAQEDEALA